MVYLFRGTILVVYDNRNVENIELYNTLEVGYVVKVIANDEVTWLQSAKG